MQLNDFLWLMATAKGSVGKVALSPGAAIAAKPGQVVLPVISATGASLVALADLLRKEWAGFDALQRPLTAGETRRIWLRRVAYLLFADVHCIVPWSLASLEDDALATLLRRRIGKCGLAKDNPTLRTHQMVGLPWDAELRRLSELGHCFYQYDTNPWTESQFALHDPGTFPLVN